ncbi:ATP-binding protein [Lactococcus raffinolactis]|uniref:ATP-binding protein n=1 Tax=Pseudolactococcus raffinolactis TaxID=1366 RepID=UPI00288F0F44|nr:ATP-binding protein [Lactococcus raffinolactis]MDT2790155.1 ATP-binding protein [Lactococcus raffinolactis]
MNKRNGIVAFHGNLMLRSNLDVYAMYEIPETIVNTVDITLKNEFKELVADTLSDLEIFGGFEVSTIPFSTEATHNYKFLEQDLAEDTKLFGLYLMKRQAEELKKQMGETSQDRFFLTIPLRNNHVSLDFKDGLKTAITDFSNRVMATIGSDVTFDEDWYERFEALNHEIYQTLLPLNGYMPTQDQTIFVNTVQYSRGMSVDKELEVIQVENNIDNFGSAGVSFENYGILTLSDGAQTTYLAILPIAIPPSNLSYNHFIERRRLLGFDTEVQTKAIFAKKNGFNSMQQRANRAKQKHKKTNEDIAMRNGIVRDEIGQAEALSEDLVKKSNRGETIISYLQSMFVYDDDYDRLQEKIKIVMRNFKKANIELARAKDDQIYLFYKHRLTEPLFENERRYLQTTTMAGFAESLFFTGQKVGSDVGLYMGRVDSRYDRWSGGYKEALQNSRNLVYYNLLQANKLDVEGKISFDGLVKVTGQMGMGKSFFVKQMFVMNSILKTKLLYFDPKAEVRKQFMKVLHEYESQGIYPEICDYIKQINFVTIDARNSENHGVLDPLVFLTGQEAKNLIISMIGEFYDLKQNEQFEKELLQTIEKYLVLRENGEKVGTKNIMEALTKSETDRVRITAELLLEKMSNSTLSLCFSNGQNKAISMSKRISIIEVTGLELPTSETSITENQRQSLVALYALGQFCYKFGSESKKESITFIDEAWFFNITDVGREIIMKIRRTGRSFNNFLVFVSQSHKDSNSELDDTGFGTLFSFNSPTETDLILDTHGIVKSEETRKWVSSMSMGQCLFTDPFGRTERITIDGIVSEINPLCDTIETELVAV